MSNSGWEVYKLGDCVRFVSGGTPSKRNPEYWNGEIPWVSAKDMKVSRLYDAKDHLTEVGVSNGTRLVTPGTVLILVRGMTLAKEFPVVMAMRQIAFNQDLKALQCSNHINSAFLFYWLQAKSYEILGLADEAAHGTKRLQMDRLQNFSIDLPPLPTQRKIALVLSAYDDLIENNARRIQILEEMAQRIYREWFVHFRFPGYEKVEMVESELGPIPEKWEIKSLQEVCTRITDGSHRSPKTTNDGFPMASVKDMHPWGFHIPQCRKIARQDYEELVRNDCKPLKGDVLVAKDGSYLKHIFVVDEDFELVILSSIALLRPNGRILPHLLSLYLLDPNVKSRMAGYVSGVAIPRIVLKDFRKFPVIAPPLDIQKHFLDLTSPIIRDCQLLMKKNDNLRQTRDLLLPKLISGEVDVTKLDPTSDTLTVG